MKTAIQDTPPKWYNKKNTSQKWYKKNSKDLYFDLIAPATKSHHWFRFKDRDECVDWVVYNTPKEYFIGHYAYHVWDLVPFSGFKNPFCETCDERIDLSSLLFYDTRSVKCSECHNPLDLDATTDPVDLTDLLNWRLSLEMEYDPILGTSSIAQPAVSDPSSEQVSDRIIPFPSSATNNPNVRADE